MSNQTGLHSAIQPLSLGQLQGTAGVQQGGFILQGLYGQPAVVNTYLYNHYFQKTILMSQTLDVRVIITQEMVNDKHFLLIQIFILFFAYNEISNIFTVPTHFLPFIA